MILARKEHSEAEMERNRIRFYRRFAKIKMFNKICWLLITSVIFAMFCGCLALTMFAAMYLVMSYG